MNKCKIKCDECLINKKAEESDEPACCAWFMDNVVFGDKSPDVCPEFKPISEEK